SVGNAWKWMVLVFAGYWRGRRQLSVRALLAFTAAEAVMLVLAFGTYTRGASHQVGQSLSEPMEEKPQKPGISPKAFIIGAAVLCLIGGVASSGLLCVAVVPSIVVGLLSYAAVDKSRRPDSSDRN